MTTAHLEPFTVRSQQGSMLGSRSCLAWGPFVGLQGLPVALVIGRSFAACRRGGSARATEPV